jgi:hypothetical protein
MKTNRKVVLVGTGFVGMSMAYSLLNQGGVDELVLIDVNKDKTIGEEMDLSHGLPYAPHRMKIKAGSYKDCKNANIVVITAAEEAVVFPNPLKLILFFISVFKNIGKIFLHICLRIFDKVFANNVVGTDKQRHQREHTHTKLTEFFNLFSMHGERFVETDKELINDIFFSLRL